MSSKARGLADLGSAYDDGALSNRNLIINGAMQVAQRGDVTGITNAGTYGGPDRFALQTASSGTWSISKSSTAPEGFSNSYKLDCTTASTPLAAGAYLYAQTILEGQNLQQLKKGAANALPVTLSFWVRSNKTGTYTVALRDVDNSRHIASTYTISSANTWEYKTVTYAGDTTGAFTNDNNASLHVNFWLGAGTNFTSGTLAESWAALSDANRVSSSNVNLADNTANEWYLTGVQLEVGDTATPFEHRSYGDELARCQRYFEKIELPFSISATGHTARHGSGIWSGFTIPFQVPKRAQPAVSEAASGVLWRRASRPQASSTDIGSGSYSYRTQYGVSVFVTESGRTNGEECVLFVTAGDYIEVEAEL